MIFDGSQPLDGPHFDNAMFDHDDLLYESCVSEMHVKFIDWAVFVEYHSVRLLKL